MFSELLLLAGIVSIAYAFYKWSTNNHDYFEKRGIKFSKPFLCFGNTSEILFKKQTAFEMANSVYLEFLDEPYEHLNIK